jgi:hypothetical protein
MRSHVAAGARLAVGCFITAGCHKATFPQPRLGAVCAATVDNKAWDRSVFSNDFSTKDRLVWIPWIEPPVWHVRVPTGEVGADDSVQLVLTFEPTQELPLVIGSFHERAVYAGQVTVRMDPSHDLVSVSWWGGWGSSSGGSSSRQLFDERLEEDARHLGGRR